MSDPNLDKEKGRAFPTTVPPTPAPYETTTFRQRLRDTEWSKRWGWNLYVTAMGTGAVMVCVHSIPYEFQGQFAMATLFFFLDILDFIICTTMTVIRAIKHPLVFKHSFYDQTEAPWLPTFNLTIATILTGMINLGIPNTGDWLIVALEVLFWIYILLGACTALILQNTFRLLPRPLHLIGPVECLECFPLMLAGSIGSMLCVHVNRISPERALTILLFAIICQGLGFWMSLIKLSSWMLHHIVLPRAPSKTLPSYMIAAGAPGFTALALVKIGNASLEIFPDNELLAGQGIDPTLAAQVFAVVGHWFGLLCVGMYVWIVMIFLGWGLLRIVDMIQHGYLGKYELSLWAFSFPLSGAIACWGEWARFFPSKAFGILNIIGTVFVFLMWLFNSIGTLTLLYNGILPGVPKEFVPSELNTAYNSTDDLTGLDLDGIRYQSNDDIEMGEGRGGEERGDPDNYNSRLSTAVNSLNGDAATSRMRGRV
ncbi:hypothetical protein I302_107969 [Kwoniella bestiolae CBS 10118]|uniref:Sulfite efflux pump SSU1 n=1 Tax=Kwoniella bestiolae CBS 10118 TaxID=1296100 RepID=A0A1B9FX18_9TREE|nr:hypothetical protein I302_07667 [Kwoniella bestiolae CBS 10118]OCF23313.1 hypothetical protein I302_07667 [Kwoniella bestiolae CBS 10118]